MARASWAYGAVLIVVMASGVAEATPRHTVAAGESLWIISQRYGCEVDALRSANRLRGNLIYPGDRLALPPSCTKRPADAPKTLVRRPANEPATTASATPPQSASDRSLNAAATEVRPARRGKIRSALVRYRVARGDNLIGLARRHGTSVDAIQIQNGLSGDLIRIGDVIDIPAHSRVALGRELAVLGPIRPILGQSLGRASSGTLVKATLLPADPVYHRRRPHLAYGTAHMVGHIRRVAQTVKSRHPKAHKLSVGDLSSKTGGRLRRHVSHQSGRDVDLGFYFTRKPRGYPATFITATATNLDYAATWTMLKSFADTAEQPGGVYLMFLNYNVQKMLYDWARERGVARSVLRWMFQYPRGRHVRDGLIRHEPGHSAHVHVRFKCPPKDPSCG